MTSSPGVGAAVDGRFETSRPRRAAAAEAGLASAAGLCDMDASGVNLMLLCVARLCCLALSLAAVALLP